MTGITVNPPPMLRVPKAFIVDPEIRAFIEQQNTIIFQLWNRTGGDVDLVEEGGSGSEQNRIDIDLNRIDIDINAGHIADNTAAIGVNAGLIADNTADIGTNAGDISTNAGDISDLQYKAFDVVEVLADVTLEEFKIAICRNTTPITITLKLLPVLGDEIQVKRSGAEVTVIGLIDGLNDQVINVLNWSSHYVFNGTDWSST
jgi:hypothetical protein